MTIPKQFFCAAAFLILTVGLPAQVTLVKEEANSTTRTYTLASPSLARNTIGNTTTASVYVLLPENYEASGEKRYPVVYYLHGFRGSPAEILFWSKAYQECQLSGSPFLLVGIEGKNFFGGSYFVNSPVSGYFEDWLIKEVIPFLESRLRILPQKEARGLLGLSMGGFSVLHHLLSHPETFSWGYAVAPGVFEPETGLDEALASWSRDTQFKKAYGAAFAGSPNAVPRLDGTPEDVGVYTQWQTSGFGGWESRLETYLAGDDRFQALAIEWGSRDGYVWIPVGASWLAGYLADAGLPVEPVETTLGHDMPVERLKSTIFPWFQARFPR